MNEKLLFNYTVYSMHRNELKKKVYHEKIEARHALIKKGKRYRIPVKVGPFTMPVYKLLLAGIVCGIGLSAYNYMMGVGIKNEISIGVGLSILLLGGAIIYRLEL